MVAYIVNFTDPEVTPFNVNSFTTDGPVAPNTLQLSSTAVRASTSLVLYGKGHPEYGERIQENLVNLLENFSGSTAPTFPVTGQAWFSRITYAMIDYGIGSPGGASVYRWTDDGSLTAGGSWAILNPLAVPLVADDIKLGGTQPSTIVNGSFWLDSVGSPVVPELYLAVNSTTSNLTATFLQREMEDLTGLITAGELTSGEYVPQKQLKIYDGVAWKNSGNVFTSKAAPQNPAIGDLWYQTGIAGSPPVINTGSPLQGGGGPLSQLFIWARPSPTQAPRWLTTGYVDRSGDVMTGTLAFGLPTSSLFIWEGQGNTTSGADLRMTGDALLTSADSFYIHIDDDYSDAGAGNNVFEIATGSQTRGSPQRPLFQVQNDGIIRSALGTGSPNEYRVLILASGDDNALVNLAYVTEVAGDVAGNTVNIATNTANIAILAGSPPIQAKVNRSGDTMTGQLFINLDSAITGSPLAGSPRTGFAGLDMGKLLIQNVQYPQVDDEAANKLYVDTAIDLSEAAATDIYVNGMLWDQSSSLLTLQRTEGEADVTAILTSSGTTDGITHTITTPFLRDTFQQVKFGSPLFGSPISNFPLTATTDEVFNVAVEDLNTRLSITEAPIAREVFVVDGGSPVAGSPPNRRTIFAYTVDNYTAGTNRLQVYVNGVKQYANERAWQKISFLQNRSFNGLEDQGSTLPLSEILSTQPNISPSAQTLLAERIVGSPALIPVLIIGSPVAIPGSPTGPGSPNLITNWIIGSPLALLTDLTGPAITYTLGITVDGGAAQTMYVTGPSVVLYQDIINEINTQITGATAVWSEKETAIVVYSNTTGTGSQITISELGSPITSIGSPYGSPLTDSLLGALSNVTLLGVGSPIPGGAGSPLTPPGPSPYTLGDITPAASGPISLVSRNLAYREVSTPAGSPVVDATYGESTSTIAFNTELDPADSIELLVF